MLVNRHLEVGRRGRPSGSPLVSRLVGGYGTAPHLGYRLPWGCLAAGGGSRRRPGTEMNNAHPEAQARWL